MSTSQMVRRGKVKRRSVAEEAEEVDEKAMQEEEPNKLAELFEEYRQECQQEREREDEARPKKKPQTDHCVRGEAGDDGSREAASGSTDEIRREEVQVDEVAREGTEEEAGEMAWDDVNDIPLPLEEVRKARLGEMQHMKDNIFKFAKKKRGKWPENRL